MVKTPVTGSERKEADQDVGTTSGTSKNDGNKNKDKSEKEQSKKEGSITGNTNSAEKSGWERSADSIP